MKMKKIIAIICAVTCILGSFAGCGKQEAAPTEEMVTEATHEVVTEATEPHEPQMSEKNQLIITLMESYLNQEQPSDVFTTYRLGMKVKGKDVPVVQFENYRYAKNGNLFYLESGTKNTGMGSVYSIYKSNSEDVTNGYLYSIDHPMDFYLLEEINDPNVTFRDDHGVIRQSQVGSTYNDLILADTEDDALLFARDSMAYGFSALPKESFYHYFMDMVETEADLSEMFHLKEDKIFYLRDAKEQMNASNCYAIEFTVENEVFNANRPKIMDEMFCQGLTTFVDGCANEEYRHRGPFTKTRLDNGPVHVTLYFDKKSNKCMAEKIDASECAKSMIEYINSIGYTESTTDYFTIESLFEYGNEYEIPKDEEQWAELENYDAYKNKIVAAKHPIGLGEYMGDVIKMDDKYQIKINMHDYMYEIWEDNTMVATVVINYDTSVASWTHNIVDSITNDTTETKEIGDFKVYMNQIPMTSVFNDKNKNNEDIGYVAIVERQPADYCNNHFVICAWDNDVLHDVVDHMTFVSTEDPAAA